LQAPFSKWKSAAQPFILTIDCAWLVCYPQDILKEANERKGGTA